VIEKVLPSYNGYLASSKFDSVVDPHDALFDRVGFLDQNKGVIRDVVLMFSLRIDRVGNLSSIDKTFIVDPTMGSSIDVVRNRRTQINALSEDFIGFKISNFLPVIGQGPSPMEVVRMFATPHNNTQHR